MKKSLLLVLLSVALIFSGCSTDRADTSNDAATLVKMIYWPGPESDAMQHVVDAYNNGKGKEDNVEVEMVLISRGGTYEREATMMSSESDEVDLYFTASYIIGQHAPYLDPLNEHLSFDHYLDTSVESLTMDGNQLAVPMDVSNHFLYYRSDLMDTLLSNDEWKETYAKISEQVVGEELQPKDPAEWDWNDFIATAAFFTKEYNADSPTQYGTALQLMSLIFNVMIWDDLLWSNGGSWLDENGEPDLKSEAAIQAMNIYRTIFDEGMTSPNATVAEFPETQEALKTGNAAFAIQWSAAYTELNDPELSPEVAGNISVAPIPGDSQTHTHSLGVGLNTFSQNKEAALKWMDYLTTSEAMTIYAENGGIPSIPEVLEAMGDDRPELPIISEHISNYGYTVPILPETQTILEILAKELTPAWVGEDDIESALDNAEKAVQNILSEDE